MNTSPLKLFSKSQLKFHWNQILICNNVKLLTIELYISNVYPGSRILIFTHLGSRILIFTLPGSRFQNSYKREWWKKISCHTFLVATNFKKDYFIFELLTKKSWAKFQRIIELFTQKVVIKLSKIWVWDPGSWKNLFRIPGSKRHRIPDPQHCYESMFKFVGCSLVWKIPH